MNKFFFDFKKNFWEPEKLSNKVKISPLTTQFYLIFWIPHGQLEENIQEGLD